VPDFRGPRDYGRFLAALAGGEGLSPETWREMTRPRIAVRGRDGKGDMNFHWGLGVGVNQTEKGNSLWHWGDNGEFNAYFEILPGKKRGVVFFMNGSNAHALTPIIARDVLGLAKPAIATAYFDYPALASPGMQLIRAFRDGGMARAVATASRLLPDQAAWRSPAGQRFLSLARIALGQGDCSGARTAADLYLQHLPDSAAPRVIIAGARLAEGDQAAMASMLDKAIELEPQLEGAINAIGQALLNAARADEAIVVLEYNAARYPKSASCQNLPAAVWLKKGEREKADGYFRKALKINPGLQAALEGLKRLEKP
jgi:tetratricopeptide (TPR) repeat protein